MIFATRSWIFASIAALCLASPVHPVVGDHGASLTSLAADYRKAADQAAHPGADLDSGHPADPAAHGGSDHAAEPSVRFLGQYVVPHDLQFEGTPVGGLSSIDYDPRTGEFAFVSDDWSDFAPARYYTARIALGASGVQGVEFTGVHAFLRPDGRTYPTIDQWRDEQLGVPVQWRNVLGTVDPEELRIDPWSGEVVWTSEGQRNIPYDGGPADNVRPTVILDPALRVSHPDGSYLRDLPTAENEKITMGGVGPRVNETFEGLTFAAAGTLIVSSMEGPLEQDGPPADAERGAYSRITVHDRTGGPLAQFAYPVEPLFAPPQPPGAFGATGISSLLACEQPGRFLALERGFAAGVGSKGRIFEFSLDGASDVLHDHSLADGGFQPVSKTLMFDLDEVGVGRTDNVEGITWGPALPSGERTLLIVSDNNFSSSQQTQILAFALAGTSTCGTGLPG